MLSREVLRRLSTFLLVALIHISLMPVPNALAQDDPVPQLFLPKVSGTSASDIDSQHKPTPMPTSVPTSVPTPDPEPLPNPNFSARLVGAVSITNTTVRVVFNKSMSIDATDPDHYSIFKQNGDADPSRLDVLGAVFVDEADSVVELTTLPQSEVLYQITASTVHDADGEPLAPKEVVGGILVDPATATFVGTPEGTAPTDSDEDGLSDNIEQTGWQIYIYSLDGTIITRHITSDPNTNDTDGDGILDADERAYGADPRLPDSDGDTLTDYQELNEIYSDPARQDTDGDAFADGLEFNFFKTSPIFEDTDGDQLNDGDEISTAIRNPRVADLPKPAIEIGETTLSLDVRFSEQRGLETRELETKSVESQLIQSDSKAFSNMNSNTQEAMAKLSIGTEFSVGGGLFNWGADWSISSNFETGWTGQWTSEHTETSEQATESAYQESLTTDEEVTEGSTVTRDVLGARMQATVFIKNASNLAYSVRNLQVVAVMQDPNDATRLIPVATLFPEDEPGEGFTLGPLVAERGPIIFKNDTIFPQLVESLMQNPRGLTFIISNFDITDELGRNFAFSSQEVVERTTLLVIDKGSYDTDGDGEGDLTEYHRIASNTGRLQDTNGDNVIDENDRRLVYGGDGKQIGITLADALEAIGLTHYDEAANPITSLTEAEMVGSYSTLTISATATTSETQRIFRIGQTAIEDGVAKSWEVLTPTGIDQTVGTNDLIMTTEGDIKLVFVADVDSDRLPANLEFVNNCMDTNTDTDGDTLDDRLETLVGWDVETGHGSRRVYSRCSLPDSDHDGVTDVQESGQSPILCSDGTSPTWATDPSSADTDGDKVADLAEICGYPVTLALIGGTFTVTTSPINPDSDGDTAPDGIERDLGGDPSNPADRDFYADNDGDGIVNVGEVVGSIVLFFDTSTFPIVCVTVCAQGFPHVFIAPLDPFKVDTDGDGLLDGEEVALTTNPSNADTDGDALTDFQEVRGIEVRDLGIIFLDPNDADTDNDKRSDGEEVEVVDNELTRWIVRVVGETPYRVFSDPLQADADFDTLVDADEYAAGTDPHKANTDGDGRDDAAEVAEGTRPLIVDFKVTVRFIDFTSIKNCDNNDDTSVYVVDFGVRRADGSIVTPVETSLLSLPTCTSDTQNFCKLPSNPAQVRLHQGSTLSLGNSGINFGITKNETFAFAGTLQELDFNECCNFTYDVGDLFNHSLQMATDAENTFRTPEFRGDELTLGTMVGTFKKHDVTLSNGNSCSVDVRVSIAVN